MTTPVINISIVCNDQMIHDNQTETLPGLTGVVPGGRSGDLAGVGSPSLRVELRAGLGLMVVTAGGLWGTERSSLSGWTTFTEAVAESVKPSESVTVRLATKDQINGNTYCRGSKVGNCTRLNKTIAMTRLDRK